MAEKKSKNRLLNVGGFILCIFLAIIIITLLSEGIRKPSGQTSTLGIQMQRDFGLAEFNQITNGMTEQEVRNILGKEGVVSSEYGKRGDKLHTIAYTVESDSSFGANALFMFQGGRLQMKSQFGLK